MEMKNYSGGLVMDKFSYLRVTDVFIKPQKYTLLQKEKYTNLFNNSRRK